MKPARTSSSVLLRTVFFGILFIAVYVLLGKFGLAFALLNKSATAIWIPTGVAIAATLIYGRKILPAVLIGAFLVNITTTGDLQSSIGIAIGNMLEALVAAALTTRFANGRKAFDQPSTLFLFVGLAGLLSTAVSASIGVATLWFSHLIQPGTEADVWLTWWVGDAVGAILIAPLILTWSNRTKLLWSRRSVVEASCLLFALASLGIFVYSDLSWIAREHYPVQYLALPILFWAAFRFGVRGTAIVTFFLAIIETVGTINGNGPFAGVTAHDTLIVLQGFVGMSSLVSLVAASVVAQYQTAALRLRMLNEQIEARIRERTEQLRQTNHALEDSRAKAESSRRTLEQLIESSPVGVLVVEPTQGKIVILNPAARTIFGHSSDDTSLNTKSFQAFDLFREDGTAYPLEERPISVVLRTRKAVINRTGIFVKKPDGTLTPIRVSCAPVRDASGSLIAIVDVIEDMTKEFQIDRAKTEFVSLAAHQLKTPLTAVRYFVELLRSDDTGTLNPTQTDYTKEIDDVTRSMTRLVSELLNVSRIDLDVFPIEPKSVHLPTIANDVIKELSPMVKMKKMHMVTEFDVPERYYGDPNLLRILFSNLIGNAVKFTPDRGTVTVKINGNEKTTRMTVADTGIGIPERQQKKIFTKLFRADNVLTKNIEGTGLGLYIVKAIVERSGGTISFESTEGKGTTFTVFLPSTGMHSKSGLKKLD